MQHKKYRIPRAASVRTLIICTYSLVIAYNLGTKPTKTDAYYLKMINNCSIQSFIRKEMKTAGLMNNIHVYIMGEF